MTSLDVYWGNGLVQLTWVPMTTLPFAEKITSAHGFCFYQNQVMLVYLKKRGAGICLEGMWKKGRHLKPLSSENVLKKGMSQVIARCLVASK